MVKQYIDNAKYILIVTHINPDADTIGSALALGNYCYENRKKYKIFNISKELPKRLNFLPRFDKITDQIPKFYDLVIYIDCANKDRADIDLNSNMVTINIDHHQSNSLFGSVNIVDETKSSTAEVLYDIFEKENFTISKNMAICLYTAIYDDSIAFTTPRVCGKTFNIMEHLVSLGVKPEYIATNFLQRDSLAKYRIMPKILDTLELYKEGKVATIYLEPQWLKETGAVVEECDDIVDTVLKIGVVKIVCYFRIINNKVRVSLRSKQLYDVSKIAKYFNGGGHINAAGCSFDTLDISVVKDELLKKL